MHLNRILSPCNTSFSTLARLYIHWPPWAKPKMYKGEIVACFYWILCCHFYIKSWYSTTFHYYYKMFLMKYWCVLSKLPVFEKFQIVLPKNHMPNWVQQCLPPIATQSERVNLYCVIKLFGWLLSWFTFTVHTFSRQFFKCTKLKSKSTFAINVKQVLFQAYSHFFKG